MGLASFQRSETGWRSLVMTIDPSLGEELALPSGAKREASASLMTRSLAPQGRAP